MKHTVRRFVLSLLCAGIFPLVMYAHPHMSLTNSFNFVFDGPSLSGVWLEWQFDRFFSADIISAYDTNGDGTFSQAESNAVYQNAFINLRHYYYFTFIREGSKRWNPPKVDRFTASIREGYLVYRFFVDLSSCTSGDVSVAVYDYTFFCDIPYKKDNPVSLTFDGAQLTARASLEENKNFPVYYNPLGAIDDATIYYTWKKGLETFYPREVRVIYESK
ncbi:MAG: DUF1007 family protein [Spirochaetales bacterium]|nr:DUF1007 family protein [Spirochaetales bacterium]